MFFKIAVGLVYQTGVTKVNGGALSKPKNGIDQFQMKCSSDSESDEVPTIDELMVSLRKEPKPTLVKETKACLHKEENDWWYDDDGKKKRKGVFLIITYFIYVRVYTATCCYVVRVSEFFLLSCNFCCLVGFIS